MLLEGKVAIVTGSGRGIGKEEALLMAKHGAKVVHDDLGPMLGHEERFFPADSTTCAGDDGNLTFEQHRESLLEFDAVG